MRKGSLVRALIGSLTRRFMTRRRIRRHRRRVSGDGLARLDQSRGLRIVAARDAALRRRLGLLALGLDETSPLAAAEERAVVAEAALAAALELVIKEGRR